jgi:hypothetical protein
MPRRLPAINLAESLPDLHGHEPIPARPHAGARPPGRITGRLVIAMVMVAAIALGGAMSCADRPAIAFANHRDYPAAIHIGGDRVLILAPHTTELLPYQVAAWTWRRRVEVREYPSGRLLSTLRASASDLAAWRWRLDIRLSRLPGLQ